MNYEDVKARAREVSALRSLVGREISPLPPVADPRRRRECSVDLERFLKTYFPRKFKKPFGSIHKRLIHEIERVVRDGGKQAVAMPRGSGKTTIAAASVVWAIANGWRRFVVVVAANTKEARKLLKAITAHFTTSAAFAADYPEIAYPLARLRGSALLARDGLEVGHAGLCALAGGGFLPWRRAALRRRGLANAPVDISCGLPLHIVGDVGVDVQRGCRRHMPQHGGESLNVHSALKRQRCEGMAQVVESHMLAACHLQNTGKLSIRHTGRDGHIILQR